MTSHQYIVEAEKMQQENFNKKITCRLCINIISYTNSEVIETATKEVLEVVLPNLILEKGYKHQMCKACRSKVFAAFNFKSTCMGTEDIISSCRNPNKVSLVDLKEVYLKVNANMQLTDIWENQRICRLCIQFVTFGFVSLNDVDNGIIDAYIPQININATKDPVICRLCFNSLRTHGGFVKDCLEAQKKYQNVDKLPYIKTEEVEVKLEDGHEEIKIKSEDQDNVFIFSHNLDEETVETKMHISDGIEETKCEYVLNSLPTHGGFVENCLEAHGKYQNVDKLPYIKTEESEVKLEDGHDAQERYRNGDKQPYIKSEEMEIKSEETDRFNDYSSHILDEEGSENKMEQFSEDIEETKYEDMLKSETEGQINKYEDVKHQTGSKKNSEIRIYKCDSCDYVTKHKGDLKSHQILHKDPSEIQMYKCDMCRFKTKYKPNLIKHLVLHKDLSEIEIFRCDTCDYKTKRKSDLKRHELKHKDPSEIQMYRCDECDYESKRKSELKIHQFTYKHSSEVQMYECDACPFKAKYKSRLKYHQLRHKDPSEIQMYTCDACDYEAKCKGDLTSHQLTHKDPSELKMYKCDVCDYETKHNSNLKGHKLMHKDPSEIVMYRCDVCDFEAKRKSDLKNHQLLHKGPSEIEMYKCYTCSFVTKYKRSLKNHQSKHTNCSTTGMPSIGT